MLSNTDSVVLEIDQINESSALNMLITTVKTQEIQSLIDEIRKSLNETERITKTNILKIYTLVSNENELQLLRESIKIAYMNTETKEFYDDYENAVIEYGKLKVPLHMKIKKRLLDKPFNKRWINIIKGYHNYIKSLCPQVTASSLATGANNNVEELDVSVVNESTFINKTASSSTTDGVSTDPSCGNKIRSSTRDRNPVAIYSPKSF